MQNQKISIIELITKAEERIVADGVHMRGIAENERRAYEAKLNQYASAIMEQRKKEDAKVNAFYEKYCKAKLAA